MITLDLLESTPIYCKVFTHQKEGPLKLKIEFKESNVGEGAPEFKLFVSEKSSEPNDSNSSY